MSRQRVGRLLKGEARHRADGGVISKAPGKLMRQATKPALIEGEGAVPKLRADRAPRRAFGGSVLRRAEGGPVGLSSLPEDPFERAALRTRESVQPEMGRQEGAATQAPEALVTSLATLPKRAFEESDRMSKGLDYDIAPVAGAAMSMVGMPGGRGGLGSGMRTPRMDYRELEQLLRAERVKPAYRAGGLDLAAVKDGRDIVAPATRVIKEKDGYYVVYPKGWADVGWEKGMRAGPYKNQKAVFHKIFED